MKLFFALTTTARLARISNCTSTPIRMAGCRVRLQIIGLTRRDRLGVLRTNPREILYLTYVGCLTRCQRRSTVGGRVNANRQTRTVRESSRCALLRSEACHRTWLDAFSWWRTCLAEVFDGCQCVSVGVCSGERHFHRRRRCDA